MAPLCRSRLRIDGDSAIVGPTIVEAEHFFENHHLFIARLRRDDDIIEATTATVLKADDAILFGYCAGSRTAAAALSMITDKAESGIPAIGYSVSYATSSIILTLFGIVIVLIT